MQTYTTKLINYKKNNKKFSLKKIHNIGILGAMEEEIATLRSLFKDYKIITYAGYKFYAGKINNINVIIVKSGVGKVAASIATTLMITHYKIDILINTGSAGGLDKRLNICDIIVSSEVRYHDVNITTFGYKIGQTAQCPPSFKADHKLIKITIDCISLLKINFIIGLICTGDSFINNKKSINYIKSTFPKVIAVDMESTAIGHVCYKFKIPFIIIRCISDITDEKSNINFNKFLKDASYQSSLVVMSVLNKINKI